MQKDKYMRITNGVRIAGLLGGMLWGGVTGCTTYVEAPRPPQVHNPPPQVEVPPPQAYVPPPPVETPPVYVPPPVQVTYVIRDESDFYEPLSRYGQWVSVAPYGRCWVPAHIESDWRPYTNGHWERTDAGWYWASDEPWGWATYHYGRWDWNPEMGWLWVPQTQWAPAWVSFHQGGGYTGWAPLHPSARVEEDRFEHVRDEPTAPRAYVFVEDRRFLEPVRPTTVVVNNTTIINKTVNITNIKVVNNTVINEGPRTTIIEQASGKKVQAVPAHDLRRKQEAAVVATRTVTPVTAVPGTIDPGRQRGNQAHLERERLANEAKAKARAEADQQAKEQEIRAKQLESARVANEAMIKAQAEAQRKAKEQEIKIAQLESARLANEAGIKAQAEAQRQAKEQEIRAAQQESARLATEARIKAQAEAQRKAKEQEIKIAQLESARLANEAKIKAQAETQRNATQQEIKAAQLDAQRRSNTSRAGVPEVVQRPAQGQVDESSASARVTKMLAEDPEFKRVNVVLSKNVIQLNGFVSTAEQKSRAGLLARKIEGVRGVQNNIMVKE
jgi:osmotically-inducible protein OsmY